MGVRIIYMGGEVPSHRNLLTSAGAKDISINYWALKRRGLPKTKDYIIADRFPDDVRVYVDSGIISSLKSSLTPMELEAFGEEYQDWVGINEERISGATEFAHPQLSEEWIDRHREVFWEQLPRGLYWPVWDEKTGPQELVYLSKEYGCVAFSGSLIEEDKTLASRTKAIVRQLDVDFHGIACAKPDNLRQVPLSTASTLSWLSPMMRGETIVWDGSKLVRYPKSMKDQARPRYKAIVEKAGLDFEKVLNDDPNEVTRLAIWSYLQLEDSLEKGTPKMTEKLSDNSEYEDDPGYAETMGLDPDNRHTLVRKDLTDRDPSELRTLPVFGVTHKTIVENEGGRDVIKDVPVITSSHASLRQCDTCFVASNCPAFKPQSACAFNLPVEVKTKEQLRSLLNTIIEMQGARVAFARFSEELNGGYPDPNTGQEIDRLFKIVKQLKELESNNEFVRMTVERQTSGGVLSALFGDKAATLSDLPNGGLKESDVTDIIVQQIEGT